MGRNAQYLIVRDVLNYPLIIQDVGPWDEHLTVTNDVEQVIKDLVKQGLLPAGRRLLYYGSEGPGIDEILIENYKFAGFRINISSIEIDGTIVID